MSTKPSYEELEQRIRELESPDPKKYSCAFISLMENATDFLYFKDKEQRFTAVSQVFAKLTGHKHWQDVIGKHDREIFPEKNANAYYESEIEIMKEGKPLLNWREPYLTLEGTEGWVNTSKWPIKDEDGNVIGLFGISRDITELVKAEKMLKKSEADFRHLFEHSHSGIAIHELISDSNGQPEDYILRDINSAYCEILNLEAATVKGQRASQVYGVNPPPLLSEYASIIGTPKSINFDFFFEPIKRWFEIKAYSHQPDSFVTVFEDITNAKKAQEDREHLISELKKALAKVKTLGGLIPICSSCKKIRDDKGYWKQIESYIKEHSEAEFSHGVCPECSDKLYGDQDWYIEMKKKGEVK